MKNERLFDPIRKKWVEKTPEELIRQVLVRLMLDKLGYPAALIAVEKELSSLARLQDGVIKNIPKRRVDLIVFVKQDQNLVPALLVECKAVDLTPKFARQVIGYNAFVKAPYVALANEQQVLTGSFDDQAGMYRFSKGLPNYFELTACFSLSTN